MDVDSLHRVLDGFDRFWLLHAPVVLLLLFFTMASVCPFGRLFVCLSVRLFMLWSVGLGPSELVCQFIGQLDRRPDGQFRHLCAVLSVCPFGSLTVCSSVRLLVT